MKLENNLKNVIGFWLIPVVIALLGWMIFSAREALTILGIAMFLALALSYPVKKFASIIPGKSRLTATFLAFMSLVLLLIGIVYFAVPPVIQQTAKFAETLPGVTKGMVDGWDNLSDFIDRNNLRPQVDEAIASFQKQATSWATSAGGNILSGVGSLVSFLFAGFLVMVLTFLMLVEGPTWMKKIWSLYRNKEAREHHRSIVDKIYAVITGYINGQLTVSGIGAVAAGIAVFILSLISPDVSSDLALPTVFITFTLSLIPMFGSTIAGVVVGLILLIDSPLFGIIYGIYFIIYQQIENNVIAPAIQSKKLNLSALAVLVAVTIGIYISGIIGVVVAIPIAGTIKILMDDFEEHRNALEKSEKQSKKLKNSTS